MGLFGIGKRNAAVIGTGYMGGRISAALSQSSKAKPYAIVSRDIDRALEFGRKNGYKKAYDSMQSMLDDSKVDFVYIATPASEHAESIRTCIERGKPVICETPLTLTSREAEELFALARSQNVLVAEAVFPRFLPLWGQAVSVLTSGTIGVPVMLTATLSADIEHISRLQRPALGGGALGDLGYYLLNFAAMAFGDDVVKVQSLGVFADTGVDRQDGVLLEYRDGRIASLSCSMSGNGANMGIIQGTKGYMVIDNIKDFETVTVYDSSGTRTSVYRKPRQKSCYAFEIDAFVEAMEQGWTECPAAAHRQTVSMLHMMDFVRRQIGVSYETIAQIPVQQMPLDVHETLTEPAQQAAEEILPVPEQQAAQEIPPEPVQQDRPKEDPEPQHDSAAEPPETDAPPAEKGIVKDAASPDDEPLSDPEEDLTVFGA